VANSRIAAINLTGRDERDRYLDQTLISPYCHECHEQEHDLLRALELEQVKPKAHQVEKSSGACGESQST